jgi:ferredoxin
MPDGVSVTIYEEYSLFRLNREFVFENEVMNAAEIGVFLAGHYYFQGGITMTDFLKFQKSNCKNCYKSIRHCPVKSIRFSGNQANVITEECILCGQCYVVCPQNAKKIADETEIVDVLLKSGSPVVASIAPSFVAYFEDTGIAALEAALKKLGFSSAEETALAHGCQT